MVVVVILTYGATGMFFVYSIYLFLAFKFFDKPADIEEVCKDLEGKLASYIVRDVPDYIEVAKLNAQDNSKEFVWHSKLHEVKHRTSARESQRDSQRAQRTSEVGGGSQPVHPTEDKEQEGNKQTVRV